MIATKGSVGCAQKIKSGIVKTQEDYDYEEVKSMSLPIFSN